MSQSRNTMHGRSGPSRGERSYSNSGRNGRRNQKEEGTTSNTDSWKRGESIIKNPTSSNTRSMSELVIGKIYDGIIKSRQNHGVLINSIFLYF